MRILSITLLLGLLAACGDTPGTTTLDSGRGHWTVINYWAEWCKPCIKEIPELNALDTKYPQVAVLGVNFDGVTGDELNAQMATLGIDFPVLEQEPSGILGVDLPSVLPATFILDPDGKLVHTLIGPQTLESLALATGQVGIVDDESAVGESIEAP